MVPIVTLMARTDGRRAEPRARQVGLLHPAGTRAVAQLRDEGHGPPAGWRVRQDHPRRGLVLDVPADVDGDELVAWSLAAAQLLSGIAFDRWTVDVGG